MSVEQRLTAAYEQQAEYQATPQERAKIADITLVAAVGAVASGKNYFMHESGFYIVGTDASRGYRVSDDREKYRYPSVETMLDRVEQHQYIQYGVNLPTESIYATDAAHYRQGTVNIKDFWFDSVASLNNKGYGEVKIVSVLTPGPQWQDQLDDRFFDKNEGYVRDRLNEARDSVRWSYAQHIARAANHLLIINDDAQTAGNVDRIRKFAHSEPVEPVNDDLVSEIANQMFATIKNYHHNESSQVA